MKLNLSFGFVALVAFLGMALPSSAQAQYTIPWSVLETIQKAVDQQVDDAEEIDDDDDNTDDGEGEQDCAPAPTTPPPGPGPDIVDRCYNVYTILRAIWNSGGSDNERNTGVNLGLVDTAEVDCSTSNGTHVLSEYLLNSVAQGLRTGQDVFSSDTVYNSSYKIILVGAVQNDSLNVVPAGIELELNPNWGITDAEKKTPAYQAAILEARNACAASAQFIIEDL